MVDTLEIGIKVWPGQLMFIKSIVENLASAKLVRKSLSNLLNKIPIRTWKGSGKNIKSFYVASLLWLPITSKKSYHRLCYSGN